MFKLLVRLLLGTALLEMEDLESAVETEGCEVRDHGLNSGSNRDFAVLLDFAIQSQTSSGS